MIDYEKLERIASELEKRLTGETETLADKIDERNEEEKEKADVPEKCLEASDEAPAADAEPVKKDAKRLASLRRLVKMARDIKANARLTSEQKKMALAKLREAANALSVSRSDLNKNLNGDVVKVMKTVSGINELVQSQRANHKSFRETLDEMKEWGAENGMKISFPENLLGKPLGTIDTAQLLELGPRIASMLREYASAKKDMKPKAEEPPADEQ